MTFTFQFHTFHNRVSAQLNLCISIHEVTNNTLYTEIFSFIYLQKTAHPGQDQGRYTQNGMPAHTQLFTIMDSLAQQTELKNREETLQKEEKQLKLKYAESVTLISDTVADTAGLEETPPVSTVKINCLNLEESCVYCPLTSRYGKTSDSVPKIAEVQA